VLRLADLPGWLLNDTFTSPKPFSLAGHSVTYYGGVVRHMFREPGIYPAVVKATVSTGDHHDTFTSPATFIHVQDPAVSTPPLSDLFGDDALLLPTTLRPDTAFQAFYISTRSVASGQYTFMFGDGTGPKEGRICSEWPHIDDSIHAIAGRLPLDEARQGRAETAVCTGHVYSRPGNYTVRVRVVASQSQRPWNIGGRVTVLPASVTHTTTVSSPL